MFDHFDDLTAFVAVAESGSFTSASAKLERDASVISRRVSQLEKRLGVRLLVRTTRSVTLTEAGAWFLHRSRAALDELAAASREVGDFASTPQGVLKVSLPVTFGRTVIAPLLPDFLAAYPEIHLDVHFLDRRVDIVAEGFDAVIRVGVIPDSSLVGRQLGSFRSLLVASPGYVRSHRTINRPEDLQDHSCLGFTSHPDWPEWVLENATRKVRLHPEGPMVTNISEALLTAVLKGVGIALLPGWMITTCLHSGELIALLPGWRSAARVSVYTLMPPGLLVPAKTRVFTDMISLALDNSEIWSD